MFDINDIAKTAFEPVLFTPLQRAQKDGYINITGVDGKKKIEYITSEKHVENYEDPEEKVRAEFFAELIYKYEYPANRIKVEVVVPDRLPTDRADIVVFSDNDCKRPYAIVECKKEGVTDAEFDQAIEQGVGNATWVKLRAEYVVIIAGGTRRVLDVSDKYGAFEREQNIIADLPRAYGKPQEFRFYKGRHNVMIEVGYALKHIDTGRMVFYFQETDSCKNVPFDVNHFSYDKIEDSVEIKTKTKARIMKILEQAKNGEI